MLALAVSSAHAQRMQFPSIIDGDSPFFAQPGPAVPLDGTPVQTAPGWDPYADSTQFPTPLDPQGTLVRPDGTVYQPIRFLQQIRFDYAWLAGGNGDDFDVNDLEAAVSFAFPAFANPSPILVTPGFAVHYWDGPDTTLFPGSPPPDLPPRVYDAYLEGSWQPVVNQNISGDLALRIGVYSDFEKVNTDSIRIQGRGIVLIGFNERLRVAAGVVYLDRNDTKLLPAGGVVYTPSEDTRFELIFPRPRVVHRVYTVRNVDLWGYVAGEYGGGAWTIERLNGLADSVDYNDIRIKLGIEITGLQSFGGYFEVGYVFNREVEYFRTATPDFKPDDTFLLGAGISY